MNALQMDSLVTHWSDRVSSLTPLLAVALSGAIILFQFRDSFRTKVNIVARGAHPYDCYKALKLVASVILSILSICTLVVVRSDLFQLCQTINHCYALLLVSVSLRSLSDSVTTRKLIDRHVTTVLLASLFVYAYRDLWPLVTDYLRPRDSMEGWLLWTKIVLLFFRGLISFVQPHDYIPVDPDPMTEPNSEQTASVFAWLTHSYNDPLILKAYQKKTLAQYELPALADIDSSRYLREWSFPFLDPVPQLRSSQPNHLFWRLLWVFRTRVSTLFLLQLLKIVVEFVAPIGINQLLGYLEGAPALPGVSPWFWVIWLFAGPMLRAVIGELYTWIACRNRTYLDVILTQLLFEHSLRIRANLETDVSQHQSTEKKDKRNMIGKINNLTTTDVEDISAHADFWIVMVCSPIQVALSIGFLYAILGWSAFMGLLVIIISLPIPGFLTRRIRHVIVTQKRKTDARIQNVVETMNILRMVKLLGWASAVKQQIEAKREDELRTVKKSKLLSLLISHTHTLIPVFTMLATYTTYTLVMKKELTAAIVFSSMPVFEALREKLRQVVGSTPSMMGVKVSLDRVDDFLKTTELLDSYTDVPYASPDSSLTSPGAVGISDYEFSWSKYSDRAFTLRIDGELSFPPGLNLVVGPTGTGKTSLLLALLGELHGTPLSLQSNIRLPRNSGVAYVPQESWILNDTVKNNILFGAAFDEVRYQQVLHQCALIPDLAIFPAGDQTEIGERGVTLSGGQKARVTLARAIYSSATALLLDDPLAALDIHTQRWIVEKCLNSHLVRHRTVILVTHNVTLTRPYCKFAVLFTGSGTIQYGDPLAILSYDVDTPSERSQASLGEPDFALGGTDGASTGALIAQEETAEGRVDRKAYKLFFGKVSSYPVIFWLGLSTAFMLNEDFTSLQTWFLGYWSAQYKEAYEVPVTRYLSIYGSLVAVAALLYTIAYLVFIIGTLRCGRIIHTEFMNSILGASLRWLDTTPVSRIITRATMDINAVDNNIPSGLWRLSHLNVAMVVRFVSIIIFSPLFLFPGLALTLTGFQLGFLYMTAQLPVKRFRSITKAPVLALFSASISSLPSVRAYGKQDAFSAELLRRLDDYSRASITFWNLNRWIAIRTEFLAGVFLALLATYFVYTHEEHQASDIGFSLTMAVVFTSMILRYVRLFNEVELQVNSLERINQYLNIDQEPRPTRAGTPPAYWPSSGSIRVEDLKARYSENGSEVLHGLSFEIKSGEHIGIVGRTGSGKSSLTLALLRGIPIEGKVWYDGLLTSEINLDALRTKITIIPQSPELLSGTLRLNLDPFSEHDDATLNDALRDAGLFSLQQEGDKTNLDLDSVVTGGGSNLSVGQRQIIGLARAMVRRSKVLILDEATSAIDYKTDAIIQTALRERLHDVTLLTVAHRLQTIMDFDRIMVLDNGQIMEFDSPKALLQRSGFFRKMVDESPDREALIAMAMNGRGEHRMD